MEKKNSTSSTDTQHNYPPVVSVLGHVDHGKTSLLDAINKTNITSKEKGAITQRIGASQVEVNHDGKKRRITFIDTPGHEAFSKMRSQGVNAGDLALLIVAADDGVKPQTRESIKEIERAKTPFIVVFTKIDLENSNVEKVKQQILKEGVALEGLGGDVTYIEVSAKTGEKVDALLDLILLVYDLSSIKKDSGGEFLGVIIDSRLDSRRGIVGTVVVKTGELRIGDNIFIQGKKIGKVKNLINSKNEHQRNATCGDAVEILGLSEIIPTGTPIFTKLEYPPKEKIIPNAILQKTSDLAMFFRDEKKGTLKLILKTETSGELETIKESLPEQVEIVLEGQGDISVSDVLLAKDFGATILGFNVKITRDAKVLAENEKVFFRIYDVIYELFKEIEDATLSLKEKGKEIILGRANIVASFESSTGRILGISVVDGKIRTNDLVKIVRGEREIGRSKIMTIKRGKQDVKEVGKSLECGVLVSPQLDFRLQDVLISYSVKT